MYTDALRAILAKKQGSSNKSKHEEQMGDIADMIAAKYGGKREPKKRSGKKKKGKENTVTNMLPIRQDELSSCAVFV